MEDILEVIKPFHRYAWVPLINKRKGKLTDSKIGGVPFIQVDEQWPQCQRCQKPLHLFLQLNSEQLPAPSFGEGILQVFYCVDDDSFDPFDKSHYLRILPHSITATPKRVDPPVQLIEHVIVGWKPVDDYPSIIELQDLNITVSDEDVDLLYDLNSPYQGDKLLGWPSWIQGVEYPKCPDCKKLMSLVFQLDSEQGLDYTFGDAGCAHVTQCHNHPNRLAIRWACC